MVHLVASLDGPTIVYINKWYERGGKGEGDRRGKERAEGQERRSNGNKEGRFTSTEQGLRLH